MSYLLINLELVQDDANNDILAGWISAENDYKEFSVDREKNIKYSQSMKKNQFTSLGHFIGVMGKFDPHSIFFDPIEVTNLDFITLLPLL